jgi:hypothetical protein
MPEELDKILIQAVKNLHGLNSPAPSMEPLKEWLETAEGWDWLVNHLEGSYVSMFQLDDFTNDVSLFEYMDLEPGSAIDDATRVSFIRDLAESRLSQTLDSLSVLELDFDEQKPAVLCVTAYMHPQGGCYVDDIEVAASLDDYLQRNWEYVIMSPLHISAEKILTRWA